MSVSLVSVLFVAAALIALGAFICAWKRQLTAAIGGLPVMFAGAGIAFAGVARFSATASGPPLIGQEMAVLLAIVALAAVALGVGLAGRESSR
jgi:NADH:ubiquinone oxidoreductase subunit K